MIAPFTGNPDLDHFLNNLEDFLFPGATAAGGPVPSYEPVGTAAAYLFQYLHVRYADNNVGSGFSNVQTNKLYLGLFNSASSVESVNPADYTWSLVSGGGFGTTKSFYYRVVPGRSVDYIVDTIAPSNFVVDTGAAINLIISSRSYARLCFSKSTENSMNTNPVSVQTLGADSFPGINTWGTGETWTELAPALLTDEILYRSEGVYDPLTNSTTWNAPLVSNLNVGSLSSITSTIGTLRTATSGQRVEIRDNVIKVFDSSNVLRVQIGDLTL